MAEQAYAYVTLIPVAKGFQGAIAKEMGSAGGAGGAALATSTGSRARSGRERSRAPVARNRCAGGRGGAAAGQ